MEDTRNKKAIFRAEIIAQIGLAFLVAAISVLANGFFAFGVIPSLVFWAIVATISAAYWREKVVTIHRNAGFWLGAATFSAVFGFLMFFLDVTVGFLKWPISSFDNAWMNVENPLAVFFSLGFFPLFFLIASATAIRAWLLQDRE